MFKHDLWFWTRGLRSAIADEDPGQKIIFQPAFIWCPAGDNHINEPGIVPIMDKSDRWIKLKRYFWNFYKGSKDHERSDHQHEETIGENHGWGGFQAELGTY